MSLRDRLKAKNNSQQTQSLQIENSSKFGLSVSSDFLNLNDLIKEAKEYSEFGLLVADSAVSEIFVNDANSVYVKKDGKRLKTGVTFKDNQHLRALIEFIISKSGRQINEKTPMVEVRFADGSRVNGVIPPLALNGPSLTIRKSNQDSQTLEELLKSGSLSKEMAEVLSLAIKARLNIVVSGSMGAGKTTLLNSLASKIPDEERIITIEDFSELALKQDNIVRLQTKPLNIDGDVDVNAKILLVNALRMCPDRIIIGQCQGEEALDMLQAINSGYEGLLTTINANSPKDALLRLEQMSFASRIDSTEKNIKSQIASTIDLIIHVNKLQDGTRKITSVSEINGMNNDDILIQEIFSFKQTDFENSKVIGKHSSTGITPNFAEQLKEKNLAVPSEYFTKKIKHTYTALVAIKKNIKLSIKEQKPTIKSNKNGIAQRFQK